MSEWRTNRETGKKFVTARVDDTLYFDRVITQADLNMLMEKSLPDAAMQLGKWHYGYFDSRSNMDGTTTEIFAGNAGSIVVLVWERPSDVGMEGSRVLKAHFYPGRPPSGNMFGKTRTYKLLEYPFGQAKSKPVKTKPIIPKETAQGLTTERGPNE